jgi:hypothetical protein
MKVEYSSKANTIIENSVIDILDREQQSALCPEHQKQNIDPKKLARWFPHFWVR